jgi:DNA-binding beta-propeller fold protein YncE
MALGNYPVGNSPTAVAFDGTNIWVVNFGSHNLTKLRAADGFNLGTISVGQFPRGIAYDGSSIWVVNTGSNSVTRLPQ